MMLTDSIHIQTDLFRQHDLVDDLTKPLGMADRLPRHRVGIRLGEAGLVQYQSSSDDFPDRDMGETANEALDRLSLAMLHPAIGVDGEPPVGASVNRVGPVPRPATELGAAVVLHCLL